MDERVSIGINTEHRNPTKFIDLEKYVQDIYSPPARNDSIICNIMAMYLLGQKILYTESKTYCEQRLNFLMLPAIFITALCTILSVVLKDLSFGSTLVSSFNGANVFLLALINYLKLDAKAEAHRVSAYKFDKLRSDIIFQSGKILLLRDSDSNLTDIISKTETNVREIKETNQFIIPEHIRYNFQKVYSMNIFSEVIRIQQKEVLCINELKDVIDKIKILDDDSELKKLYESQRRLLIDKFICIQSEYLDLDNDFEEEVLEYSSRVKATCSLCGWLKT
jgi:hypothetical protein